MQTDVARHTMTSTLAGRIADHRTLCVGILYGATILAVLAVTRLF
jgi:hypothetical protein